MSKVTYVVPTLFQRLRWWRSSLKYKIKKWVTKNALGLVIRLQGDSNYLSHVRREVPEWFKEEGPNKWMADGTIELLAVLSSQGHSGGSIGFALKFFETMAKLEPWGPLTGDDNEWTNVSKDVWQNKRCSHVFKGADGRAYDIDGKIFRESNGSCYTGKNSRVYIDFPYIPKSEYVNV